jgi:hypothetical protein
MQCLGHFSPLPPPPPLPPTPPPPSSPSSLPSRNYFALISNFVEERISQTWWYTSVIPGQPRQKLKTLFQKITKAKKRLGAWLEWVSSWVQNTLAPPPKEKEKTIQLLSKFHLRNKNGNQKWTQKYKTGRTLKKKSRLKGWGHSSVVECLLSRGKALSWIPSTAKILNK